MADSEKHGYMNFYKVPFHGILRKATWQTPPNIAEISMAGTLPYLLITMQGIDMQKVSVSDMQNIKTVS